MASKRNVPQSKMAAEKIILKDNILKLKLDDERTGEIENHKQRNSICEMLMFDKFCKSIYFLIKIL